MHVNDAVEVLVQPEFSIDSTGPGVSAHDAGLLLQLMSRAVSQVSTGGATLAVKDHTGEAL